MEFLWNGHLLEVDETEVGSTSLTNVPGSSFYFLPFGFLSSLLYIQFPFGIQYEIECESSDPERAKTDM